MKVLIVSDTHRKNDLYLDILDKEKPDLVLHCGDSEGSEYALTAAADCPVHIVLGNNDFFSNLPRELILEIGPHTGWMVHGHNYHVSLGTEYLADEALDRGADVVLFGHTHRPFLEEGEEMTICNPGSLSYPRQEGRCPTYALMELEEGKKTRFTICYCEPKTS